MLFSHGSYLKGHGNEADFLGFLQKLVPHKSFTLPFEPFPRKSSSLPCPFKLPEFPSLKLSSFSLAPELVSPLRALAPSLGGAADSAAAAGPRRCSPATVAARGAPGWERFLGGTSSNLTFTSEEARKFRRTKVVAI
jgi:hypothetical protein